ncbi:MAG: hypothetical protein AVDCRST_MAG16-58, partial [uncultured Frankineae bacterium]
CHDAPGGRIRRRSRPTTARWSSSARACGPARCWCSRSSSSPTSPACAAGGSACAATGSRWGCSASTTSAAGTRPSPATPTGACPGGR